MNPADDDVTFLRIVFVGLEMAALVFELDVLLRQTDPEFYGKHLEVKTIQAYGPS